MAPKRTCKFKQEWLINDRYKSWLKTHESCDRHAVCTICKYDIDLGNIRIGALESHRKGKGLDLRDKLRNNVEKRRKMEKSVERIVREADELSLKAAAEKDFAFLEKSNAKRQQAIQMKSEIEKTTESVSKIEKKIKEL